MIAFNADEFRDQFGECLPVSTGSLRGDVDQYGGLALTAHWDFQAGREPPWEWCNGMDLMDALQALAANLTVIYAQLVEQGFAPPTVRLNTDPVGYVAAAAEFLTRIFPLVVDPPYTVH